MSSRSGDEFSTLLRRERRLAGLSQEALAERAGLSVRGLSDLERGLRRAPHPATIARLADALGLRVEAREALLLAVTHAAPAEPTHAHAPPPASDAIAAGAELSENAGLARRAEERRWVTVVAVQLGGFAGLAQQLDPEDLHALTEQYVEQIQEEVRRLDGTVLRGTGESTLAVFGAPTAHEDDADRAVRVALAIRDSDLPIPEHQRLYFRIGVETGEVLARLDDATAISSQAVSGVPVSVASGLAASCVAPAVLVGRQTYQATQRHVRYRSAARVQPWDWPRPIEAWEALEVGLTPSTRPLRYASFVGRSAELSTLSGALDRVLREQRPHLVSVLGEAGIGKSRLITEFEDSVLARSDVNVLHGRCLPYGGAASYGALAMALYDLAGITPETAADEVRARLGLLVRHTLQVGAHDPDAREIERRLALLCGLEAPSDVPGTQPDERSVHVSVRRFLEALARVQPTCLLVEDVHWADDALLSLLEHVAERAVGAPLLLVTQARPELLDKRPRWGGGVRSFTSLLLEPLDHEAGRTLADALCREHGLASAQVERISSMAGGNPLFAEELSATLAEGRGAGVPSALRPLVTARLDALPASEKRALQVAAVLGTHVWLDGLAALELDGNLPEQLEALERRDLLRAQPVSRFRGQREYAFKHQLIQEMAYGLLPRVERRRLHARIVDWLEQAAGERVDESLDLLAHHAVSAELYDRALDYFLRAAERAHRAAAHREAAALLEHAIDVAARCNRMDMIPEIHARRGRALARLTLWAEARRELEAALAGLPRTQAERRAEVLVDLALACNWTIDEHALRESATQGLALATRVQRPDLAMDASFWLAWATGSGGDLASAIDQYQTTVVQTNELGIALAPSVLPLYATALCWAGHFPLAVERGREAVRIAREAGDTDSTILAMQVLGLACAGTGAYSEAARVFAEATRFGREYGVGPFLARAIAMSAGFHLDVFDFEGHLTVVEEACELARSAGFMPPLISATIDKLLNLARRGEPGGAEALEAEVAPAIERAGAWHAWLWALRLAQARAELALTRGDFPLAVRHAESALAHARGRRPKYEALALLTRASALLRMGEGRAAVADLQAGVAAARAVGDPALFVRSASGLLAHAGTDELLSETRAAARHIYAQLPTPQMRERFLRADAVRGLDPAFS